MSIKNVVKFIRVRGRIVPVRLKKPVPKAKFKVKTSKKNPIMFHQTTKEAAMKIQKEGFDLSFLGARKSDILPDGVFLKRTDKKIGLKGDYQLKVKDLSEKTGSFETRNAIENFMFEHGDDISKLQVKIDNVDRVMKKKNDKLFKVFKKFRGKGSAGGKMNKHLNRWSNKVDQISGEMRKKSLDLFKREVGHDSLIIEKDYGSFGRVTDTKIVFNPKDVRPMKKVGIKFKEKTIPKKSKMVSKNIGPLKKNKLKTHIFKKAKGGNKSLTQVSLDKNGESVAFMNSDKLKGVSKQRVSDVFVDDDMRGQGLSPILLKKTMGLSKVDKVSGSTVSKAQAKVRRKFPSKMVQKGRSYSSGDDYFLALTETKSLKKIKRKSDNRFIFEKSKKSKK